MNRTILSALALLAVVGAGATARAQSTSGVAGVRDRAGMFSAGAVKDAEETLRDVRRRTHWSALVETVDTLDGKTIKAAALANASALHEHGLYILMAKKEHKFYAAPSQSASKAFGPESIKELDDTITQAFKAGKFDQGLLDAVALIRRDAEATPDTTAAVPSAREAALPKTTAAAPPARDATQPTVRTPAPTPAPAPAPVEQQGSVLPMLLIGGGVVLLVLWLLSRAFRGSPSPPQQQPYNQAGYGPGPARPAPGPGYGPQPGPGYAPPPQPGYGPPPQPGYGYAPPPPQHGGGGFLSGVLGGAAGAVAGNILYDKFGHPHEAQGAPPHVPAGVVPPQGAPWPQGDTGAGPGAPIPPTETFDPNAGGGGDWGTPEPAADPNTGASGDWGSPEPAADPNAGASGDWGTPDPDPAPEPDAGGGGDWGSADPGTDDNQGGSW